MRDCCPYCETNKFVSLGDISFNICRSAVPERNGVRFIYGLKGVTCPVSYSPTCHNPCCPENIQKLEKRSLKSARQPVGGVFRRAGVGRPCYTFIRPRPAGFTPL